MILCFRLLVSVVAIVLLNLGRDLIEVGFAWIQWTPLVSAVTKLFVWLHWTISTLFSVVLSVAETMYSLLYT